MTEKRYRIGFVVAEYNYDITMMMLERARSHAEFLGCEVKRVLKVPGVYDIPLALKKLLKEDDIDGAVTLGAVIEGETDHDDLIIQQSARKIMDLSLESDKPVGLGITGPGMSRNQAQARIENARAAVEACVKLLERL
jgi:6,7-dimethyl-8-ribityllumazine synthase